MANSAADPWLEAAFVSCALAICVWISVTDIRRGIIPNAANLALAAIGLARVWLLDPAAAPGRLLAAIVVATLLLLLRAVYRRLRGVTGLGLGDVKFIAAASLWTGPEGVQAMIVFACASALVEALVRRMSGAGISRMSRIRFAPHLAAGFAAGLSMDAWLAAGAQSSF